MAADPDDVPPQACDLREVPRNHPRAACPGGDGNGTAIRLLRPAGRRLALSLLGLALLLPGLAACFRQGLTGSWSLTSSVEQPQHETYRGTLRLRERDDALAGAIEDWPFGEKSDLYGWVSGRSVRLIRTDRGSGFRVVYEGVLSADRREMRGTWVLRGVRGSWVATRLPPTAR